MRVRGSLRTLAGVAIGAMLLGAVIPVPVALAVETDMAINRTAIDFGDVEPGQERAETVVLTNTGGDPFGPINMFGGAPPTAEFNASQNCQGVTLPAGGSCTVTYRFSPGSSGTFNDQSNFTISETASQSDGENFTVSLTGRGFVLEIPTLAASTTDLDFGDAEVGSTRSIQIVITNTGADPLTPTWTGVDPSDPMNFSGTTDCIGVTLAAGAMCRFTYEFHPVALGPVHAVTNIGTGLGNPLYEFPIEMRGVGVQPAPTATPTRPPAATPTSTPTQRPAATPRSTPTQRPAAAPTSTPSQRPAVSASPGGSAAVSPPSSEEPDGASPSPSIAPQAAAAPDNPVGSVVLIVSLLVVLSAAVAAAAFWLGRRRSPGGSR